MGLPVTIKQMRTQKLILFLATIEALFCGLFVIEGIGGAPAPFLAIGLAGLVVSTFAFIYVAKHFELPA